MMEMLKYLPFVTVCVLVLGRFLGQGIEFFVSCACLGVLLGVYKDMRRNK